MTTSEERQEAARRARVLEIQREFARLTRVMARCDQRIAEEQRITARLMERSKR